MTVVQNKRILTINPAYQTSYEQQFWQEFNHALNAAGWELIELAAREIPTAPTRHTIILPARLKDFALRSSALPGLRDLRLRVPWLRDDDILILLEWERLRWQLMDEEESLIVEGIIRLAALLDSTIRQLQPAYVFSTNKIDHPCFLGQKAADYHGIPYRFIERSPFETIWVEERGMFTESRLWEIGTRQADSRYRDAGRAACQRLLSNPAGFRKDQASSSKPKILKQLPRPLIFLPMDNVLWTGWAESGHPQNPIDNPSYATPQAAMQALADIAKTLGGSLLIKKHPSCQIISPDTVPDNAHLLDGDLRALIEGADVVVTFLTKLAYLGAALQKPTLVLAKNTAALSPALRQVLDPAEVKGALEDLLQHNPAATHHEAFLDFCGWLDQAYFYRLNTQRTNDEQQSTLDLVQKLITASDAHTQGSDLAATVENLRAIAKGQSHADYPLPAVQKRPLNDKIRLAFDVWRLAVMPPERGQKHGINRYAFELFQRLQQPPTIEVQPVINHHHGAQHNRYRFFLAKSRQSELWLGQDQQVLFPLNRDTHYLAPFDLFFSPVNALPSLALTGAATRILTIHDIVHILQPTDYVGGGKAPVEQALESVQVTRDVLFCDSQSTKDDVLRQIPIDSRRVFVVPVGIDAVFYRPQAALALALLAEKGLQPGAYFMALGQVSPRKNIIRLVEAYLRLESQGHHTWPLLLIVHDAITQSRLKEMIIGQHLRSSAKVKFVHSVDDDMLASLYHHAGAFVYPSLYEGFGLPVAEAFAAGCPVIASDRSCIPEVGRDAVFSYINPEDVESIVAAMQAVQNSNFSEEARHKAKSIAAEYTWENVGAYVVELIQHIFESTRPQREQRRQFWEAMRHL